MLVDIPANIYFYVDNDIDPQVNRHNCSSPSENSIDIDCYREIKTVEDTLKLQKDIDLLGSWARKWGMRFQPVKCNMMQLTNKRINKIEASYTLEGTVLENFDSIKYLGVTITNDLKWNTHINNICTKANRTPGFLRRNLFSCPQDVKEAAYKGLVRPVLIDVMTLKRESGRFVLHFREVFRKCIKYIGKFLVHFREISIFH